MAFADHEIQSELGRGGMGRVLRVRHRATGAARALKVLDGVSGVDTVLRFQREAEALARLGGRGAVPVHEIGVHEGRLYYVMDLMPGGSLRARLDRRGRFEWREACALVARLARIVATCHARGLVHRDLKPENVLFDDTDEPRLADFGCVRDARAQSLTEPGEALGTLHYMAPEQLNGLPVDGRADVFALGVVLHELVSGERPFRGATWSAQLLLVGEESREPLTKIPGVPASLEAAVARALATRLEDRTKSAEALAADLDSVLAGGSAEESETRIPFGLLVTAALLVLVGVSFIRGRSASSPPPPPHGEGEGAHVSSARVSSEPAAKTPPAVRVEDIDAARAAVAAVASNLNVIDLAVLQQRDLETLLADARGAAARMKRLDDRRLASVLEPLVVAVRGFVVGPRTTSTPVLHNFRDLVTSSVAGLEGTRRPQLLELASKIVAPNEQRAAEEAGELRAFAASIAHADPLLAARVYDAAAHDFLTWSLRGGGVPAMLAAGEVLEAADRASQPLSGEDALLRKHFERVHAEQWRDVEQWFVDYARPGETDEERAQHRRAATTWAWTAARAEGADPNVAAQALRVMLDVEAPLEEIGRLEAEFQGIQNHVLYLELLRRRGDLPSVHRRARERWGDDQPTAWSIEALAFVNEKNPVEARRALEAVAASAKEHPSWGAPIGILVRTAILEKIAALER